VNHAQPKSGNRTGLIQKSRTRSRGRSTGSITVSLRSNRYGTVVTTRNAAHTR
jgi:hypothetical protein